MSDTRTSEWIAIAAAAAILAVGINALELGIEPGPPKADNLVEITTWNWKKDRAGRILAVFGMVKNRTPEAYSRVILELRTEDEDKEVIARHAIEVGRVEGNAERPFREDVPRTGREHMGFLEVKSLAR